MTGGRATAMRVRAYEDGDEPAVLELLEAAMGAGPAGARAPAFFRWKHLDGPFGRSFLMLAEDGGRVVGLRAFMRWRFAGEGGIVNAVRAVDTATHPDHRGRGIFTRLTLEALDALRGECDLVFNTPNEQSLPGYLKMGWKVTGRVPIGIRVRRPVRFARHLRNVRRPAEAGGAPPASPGASIDDVVAADAAVDSLLLGARSSEARLHTPLTRELLLWRYSRRSRLGYSCVRVDGPGGIRGLGVFRERPRGALREATIADVIVRDGDRDAARKVLRAIRDAAHVDHFASSWAPGTAQRSAARSAGFVRMPGGMTLVVNPLTDALTPDPRTLASWALSLGDLEVF